MERAEQTGKRRTFKRVLSVGPDVTSAKISESKGRWEYRVEAVNDGGPSRYTNSVTTRH